MLPFIGYHVGDYLSHWLDIGTKTNPDKLPKIFYVNWFRRDKDGKFLWPGFGENSRILKWVIQRIEGEVDAVKTPIGLAPNLNDLDLAGLSVTSDQLKQATKVDKDEWLAELPMIEKWFESIGGKLPSEMRSELSSLKERILN